MRLIKVRPTYFRGFGASSWINLDSDLVLIFGPNGYGKTSLAEAVEWLIHGKTLRREKGNEYSRLEYRGSYRNAHAPDDVSTAVSARFRFADGTDHDIERVLRVERGSDEGSRLLIDGNEALLDSIDVDAKEAFYPIIVQHGLQDFIHLRPIDRRDAISAAFGLELLIRFKSALEQARNTFRNNPPTAVTQAKRHLQQTRTQLADVPSLEEINAHWSQSDYDPDRDFALVLERTRSVLDDQAVAPTDASERLDAKKREVSASVFDIDAIRPHEDQEHRLRNLGTAGEQAGQALRQLDEATRHFLDHSASAYAEELLRFWEQGLTLAADFEDDLCPMCESQTLTAPKQDELRERIEANEEYRRAVQGLQAAATQAASRVESFAEAISALSRPQTPAGWQQTLGDLFADNREIIQPLVEALESCASAKTVATMRLDRLTETTNRIRQRAEHSRGRRRVLRAIRAMQQRVTTCIDEVTSAWQCYPELFSIAEPEIAERVSSDAAVKELDALIDLWRVKEQVAVLAIYHRLVNETLDDLREVEQFIQTKHTELFESRGGEVRDWYDAMCPGADVRYTGMEAVTDAIKLHAESFGQRISAAPCLSQSQLNCLGLSVYIMRATTPESSFGFVIFDDPVQSMDDEHCESFMEHVIGKLLDDHNRQVIVLSHLQGITDRIRTLHHHRRFLRYRIDQFDRSGPSIASYDPLDRDLRDIQSLADGNENNRKLAVQKLRPTIERIVRELHLKETGTQLDDSLARATATELLRVFSRIPNTTPQEHQGFRDTVSFADPAHHTEEGWQVPTKPQILPHIDRLREFARRKGLIQ